MAKRYILSVAGLGNSLLTALALNESKKDNNINDKIIINNSYAQTIFENINGRETEFIRFRKIKSLKFILFLLKFIVHRKKIIIAEPNTSKNLILLMKILTLSKVNYQETIIHRSLEEEYNNLFKLEKKDKKKIQFKMDSSDYAVIYPTVESVEKESKKITETQIESIIRYFEYIKIGYEIVIPEYEKYQLNTNFLRTYSEKIRYIKKFKNFEELTEYLNKFSIYIGSDTFYYNVMSKHLQKKCYVVFGSTSYKRIIYNRENTKFVYPMCSNYPMYDKYFSKVKYCKECESKYCIDKLQIDLKK